jgi:4-amino-4-deoxy-L-arabinose transferase-like glycosyltransferase
MRTWLLLGLVLATAVFLRFYQLGEWPPGLYQDEAYNGLDALTVLEGARPLFFATNNGREPAYIYLTAVNIALFGNSVFALRLTAAIVGSLTVIPVYLLAQSWFGTRVGLLSAWLWAVTLWPLHLSRLGLRAILLLPLLALLFWLGTLAWRQNSKWLWLAAGAIYGLAFYTYLAVRFTPVLLVAVALFLLWRGEGRKLWAGLGWFVGGTAVVLSPWLLLWFQQPDLLLGRSGQVSILSPDINGGNLIGTLFGNIARALGMFIGQGDDILRHNPAQRPVFDWLMALPFLLGLFLLLRRWREYPASITLLWVLVMLGPTILAEDTPHFLRAVGVLPAVLLIPAVGLNRLLPTVWGWDWRTVGRTAVVMLILLGSLGLTVRDYAAYAQQPETAHLFEAAVRTMAQEIRADIAAGRTVWLEKERFWDKYASLRFLLADVAEEIELLPSGVNPAWGENGVLYLWPHDRAGLEGRVTAVLPPAQLTAHLGPTARGDLEPQAYPLYTRYAATTPPQNPTPLAQFAQGYTLYDVDLQPTPNGDWTITLLWHNPTPNLPPATTFIHLLDPTTGQLIAQSDQPPSQNLLPTPWWQPNLWVEDHHQLTLPPHSHPTNYQLWLGIYPSGQPDQRLPLLNSNGDTAYQWQPPP